MIVAHILLLLGLPLYAALVTQTSSSDPFPYDAVVLGTNDILELVPAKTGLPIPVSTLTNVDIESCASTVICVEGVFTNSASHIVSSEVAKFNVLPASIVTAIEGIVDAIEVGAEPGRASSITIDGGLSIPPTAKSTRQTRTTGSVLASQGSSGRSALSNGTLPVQSTTPSSVTGTWTSAPTSAHYSGTAATALINVGSYISKSEGTTSNDASAITSVYPSGVAATTSATNGSLSVVRVFNTGSTGTGPSSAPSLGQGGSSITGSGNLTTPVPTSPFTYVLEVTNSRSSVTDEVLEVGYHSGVRSTNLLFAYADSVTTTETSTPSGVSIQTITTSTCTTAGAVVSAISSGSTVTTEVPQLCVAGLAFRIFGLPGFHSSLDLPSLCHRVFSFPLGIIWRLLCPPGLLPRFLIISDDPEKLPPGGGPPGENPNDGEPDNEEPNPTETPEPTMQNTTPASPLISSSPASQSKELSSVVVTSSRITQSTVPSSTVATSSRTTRSTMTSSAAATPTRYIVWPFMNASQSSIDSLFAPYAQRANVTPAKGSDGLLRYFAVELSDSERSAIDARSDFLTLPESTFDIEMPDTGQEDPDLNGATYASEPLDPNPNVGSRGLPDHGQRSKDSGIFKRIPLQSWAQRFTTWSLAMISLVPSLPLPNYQQIETVPYPYYFVNPPDPVATVRVYAIDTGLNMQHPEFNGRLRPGITEGQTQDDWDIDWLFPKVDFDEFFTVPDDRGGTIDQKYEYSYIDPNSPNSNGGIHPAYSDFRLREINDGIGDLTPHGTRVSAFIMGDVLGQAQNCRYTMVKLPQYTNGPRSGAGLSFPLFAAARAIIMIRQDIQQRKDQGENLFIISSSLGHLVRRNDMSEGHFESFWDDFLDWVDENGITIVASAGNSRQRSVSIDLVPARLFRNPQIVVGSVTPDAMAHPRSQGDIGDGILTAYAPSAGALMLSSNPNGDYTYQWLSTAGSAVTSFGTY